METKNARITSTMLGVEDFNVMSFSLNLDYGDGAHQNAGGYALDTPIRKDGEFIRRVGTAEGLSLIMDILDLVEVGKWEDLKGKPIRVRCDHSHVTAIGHFLKDRWIVLDTYFTTIKTFTSLIKE